MKLQLISNVMKLIEITKTACHKTN